MPLRGHLIFGFGFQRFTFMRPPPRNRTSLSWYIHCFLTSPTLRPFHPSSPQLQGKLCTPMFGQVSFPHPSIPSNCSQKKEKKLFPGLRDLSGSGSRLCVQLRVPLAPLSPGRFHSLGPCCLSLPCHGHGTFAVLLLLSESSFVALGPVNPCSFFRP